MMLSQLMQGMPLLASLLPEQMAQMEITGVTLDSRQVKPGNVFFAVPGVTMDGRQFIDSAIQAGAALVMEETASMGLRDYHGVPVIAVPQLRRQVGELCARFYQQPGQSMLTVGVTGTNGKTSVAWFVRDALNALRQRCALVGTLGFYFEDWHQPGVHTTPDPVTLQQGLAQCRDKGANAVVMEASSHALHQHRLAGVSFAVAIFTNLTRDHLDYHGDMESYFEAKQQLFLQPGLKLAVINAADQWGEKLIAELPEGCKVVTFGSDAADINCVSKEFSHDGMRCQFKMADQTIEFDSALYGSFNIENLMAVAALLFGLDYSVEQIGEAMKAITAVPGRMQSVNANSKPSVLIDYAHTPDALEKALTACRAHFSGSLTCVVGCGGNRDQGKRAQMAATAETLSDGLVFTSDNPRFEKPEDIINQMLGGVSESSNITVLVDRQEAVAQAIKTAKADDVVLLAGKGHEDYQEIAGVRYPMSDLELAKQALAVRDQGGAQ